MYSHIHLNNIQKEVFHLSATYLFSATLAGFFELEVLVETMCIGTVFSYTAVAASVVVLRSVHTHFAHCKYVHASPNNTALDCNNNCNAGQFNLHSTYPCPS